MSIFSNLRPSKIYPNWDFWVETKPSGNPAVTVLLKRALFLQMLMYDVSQRDTAKKRRLDNKVKSIVSSVFSKECKKNLPQN
jgi:hypothetical protein